MPKSELEYERYGFRDDPRMPVVEIDPGRHVNPNAAAIIKQEYASNAENDEMDHRRPAMRKVVSGVGRIVDSFGLRSPTMLSIKSLLEKLVRTGLEWIRPPRDHLDKEPVTAVWQEIKLEPRDDPETPRSMPSYKRLK